jgi:integrase/recombinase XerD
MAQAKVLNEKEVRQLLRYIAQRKHSGRNRAMLLCTHLAGMRIGEVASLRLCDVLNADGSIRDEMRLSAEQTKGDRGRVVLLCKRLQDELRQYLCTRFRLNDLKPVTMTNTSRALFDTQKNPDRGFTSNTATQLFHYIYKRSIACGSSHSGRRGFITQLANKGTSVRVLAALAGHQSIATTQRYIELNPAMMRNAVELI